MQKFGAILLLPGILLLIIGLFVLSGALKAKNTYKQTAGIIISKNIEKSTLKSKRAFHRTNVAGRNVFVYRPVIKFRYTVENQEYISEQYDIGKTAQNKEWAENILNTYVPDQQVEVWYDPASPDKAVLSLAIPGFGVWGTLVGLAIVVFGSALILFNKSKI